MQLGDCYNNTVNEAIKIGDINSAKNSTLREIMLII